MCHADLGAVCFVQLSAKGLPLGILTPQLCGHRETKLKTVGSKRTNIEGDDSDGESFFLNLSKCTDTLYKG